MRAVLQRVNRSRVRVGEETVGEIGVSLLVLVGATHTDTEVEARKMAAKVLALRVFDDHDGVMNLSVVDVGGAVLVVSQFTLYGDVRKGRRPSWHGAAPRAQAEPLAEAVAAAMRDLGATVATGRFGAHMQVELENDGPVTLVVET